MVDSVTEWFKIKQYNDEIAISTMNLVEATWMSRYPKPMEITYELGKECIGHESINPPN